MRNIKKTTAIILICLIVVLLSACNETLKDKNDVISEITRVLPNAKFVNYKNGDRERVYVFNTDDFSFEYRDYLYDDSVFGFDQNSFECDYLDNLFAYLKDDILRIAKNNDVYIYDGFSNKAERDYLDDVINENNIVLYVGYYYHSTFYIHDYDDIETIDDFLDDMEELLEDYMLQDISDIYKENITIEVNYKENFKENSMNQNSIYNFNWNFTNNGFNVKTFKKWVQYWYQEYIIQGLLFDDVNTSKHKPHKITTLYIDGDEFESEIYDFKFIYNLEDDNYYVEVRYGTDIENVKIPDSIQKEIIEEYYKNSNYSIDAKLDETTYKIGKNKYTMNWTYKKNFSKDRDKMQFYKNGKLLSLDTYDRIGNTYVHGYHTFMSVDDFAMLMEMKVDKIDTEKRIIYLETT